MQARLIHDETSINPDWDRREAVIAKKKRRAYNVPRKLPIPAGTTIDRPDAYKLVLIGAAEPADEACEKATGLTPAQLKRVQREHAVRSGYLTETEEDEDA